MWASVRQRQNMMRLFEVRRVDHLAVDLEHADPGVGREGVDDRLRSRHFFGRGREGGVDRTDLRRVDRHHARKAVAPCTGGLGSTPGLVIDTKGIASFRANACTYLIVS